MANDKSEIWSKMLYIIIGTVIGAAGTILVAYYDNWKKERQTKKDLIVMICIDVTNTKKTLEKFVRVHPPDKLIKQGNIIINDFDTYFFGAYIHKLPLLPVKTARTICAFYGDLKKANEAKYILLDKNLNLSKDSRIVWKKNFRDNVLGAIKKADCILDYFGRQGKGMSSENTIGQYTIDEVTITTGSSTVEGGENLTSPVIDLNTSKP